jgi:hypothetical protein
MQESKHTAVVRLPKIELRGVVIDLGGTLVNDGVAEITRIAGTIMFFNEALRLFPGKVAVCSLVPKNAAMDALSLLYADFPEEHIVCVSSKGYRTSVNLPGEVFPWAMEAAADAIACQPKDLVYIDDFPHAVASAMVAGFRYGVIIGPNVPEDVFKLIEPWKEVLREETMGSIRERIFSAPSVHEIFFV